MDIQTILQIIVISVIIPMAIKLSSLDRQVGEANVHIEHILKALKKDIE